MKVFVCLMFFVAMCSAAEEEKKTEKRGVVGLGYGGYGGYNGFGYGGLPLGGYSGYPYAGAPLGYSHGLGLGHGLPLAHAGLPLAHGFAAPALHAPYITKTVAPIAPVSYASPLGYAPSLHAPIISKTIAPVSHFGYSSPYLGLGHGLPYYH